MGGALRSRLLRSQVPLVVAEGRCRSGASRGTGLHEPTRRTPHPGLPIRCLATSTLGGRDEKDYSRWIMVLSTDVFWRKGPLNPCNGRAVFRMDIGISHAGTTARQPTTDAGCRRENLTNSAAMRRPRARWANG